MPMARVGVEAYKRILAEAAVDGVTVEAGLDRLIATLDVKIEQLEIENRKLREKLAKVGENSGGNNSGTVAGPAKAGTPGRAKSRAKSRAKGGSGKSKGGSRKGNPAKKQEWLAGVVGLVADGK